MNENELPEPKEGIDFYINEWRRYTINIEVEVNMLQEDKSDIEICSEAIYQFKDGEIDGSGMIVHSEKIKDVELDYKADLPFDRQAWQISKCAELGFDRDGTPLRPWQKEQPKSQTEIKMFLGGGN